MSPNRLKVDQDLKSKKVWLLALDFDGFGSNVGSDAGTRMGSKIDKKIVKFWRPPGRALGREK